MLTHRMAVEYPRCLLPVRPDWVAARLRAVVADAYRHVRFYRDLMDAAGVRPDDVRTIRDFMDAIPAVEASDYRSVQRAGDNERLMDPRFPAATLYLAMSSGSSGIPVRVLRSAADAAHDRVRTAHHLVRGGLRPWHRTMSVTHPRLQVPHPSPIQRLGLFYRRTIHALMPVEEVREIIRRERIDAIYGNVDFIAQLADECQGANRLRLRVLYPGAGVVSASTRRYLCETFRPHRYAEYYGATESGIIAIRLDHHYVPDFRSVFFCLRDTERDGDYTRGSILLTSLRSAAQPIINLEVGDSVVVDRYERHERLETTIVRVEGRRNDFFLLGDGRRLSGTFFYKLLESFDFVRRFQVVQRQAGHCEVLLVVDPAASASTEAVAEALRQHGRGRFRFDIRIVDRIPVRPGGKHKILVSELDRGQAQ